MNSGPRAQYHRACPLDYRSIDTQNDYPICVHLPNNIQHPVLGLFHAPECGIDTILIRIILEKNCFGHYGLNFWIHVRYKACMRHGMACSKLCYKDFYWALPYPKVIGPSLPTNAEIDGDRPDFDPINQAIITCFSWSTCFHPKTFMYVMHKERVNMYKGGHSCKLMCCQVKSEF